MARHADLPATLEPLGVTREEAAAAIRLSPSTFDQLVADGRMPQPRVVGTRRIWSVRELRLAFDALPSREGAAPPTIDENEWDDVR